MRLLCNNRQDKESFVTKSYSFQPLVIHSSDLWLGGNPANKQVQQRLLRFHQTRAITSPWLSSFRQELDRDRHSAAQTKLEQPQGVSRTDKSEALSKENPTDHLSLFDDKSDEFPAWLESIRHKRRQMQEYLARSVVKSRNRLEKDRLHESYLGPHICAPTWLVHILESGISLTLIPTFLADDECRTGDGDVTSRQKLKLGLSTARAISHYRKLRYSPLALSEPAILLSEEVFSPLSTPSGYEEHKCAVGDINAESNQSVQEEIEHSPGRSDKRHPTELCHVARRSSSNTGFADLSSDDASSSIETQTGARLQYPLRDLRASFSMRLNTRVRPLVTLSAAVTECRERRVVISGCFQTLPWGYLPFQLVVFPQYDTTAKLPGINGIFLRKSMTSSARLRWKFQSQIST